MKEPKFMPVAKAKILKTKGFENQTVKHYYQPVVELNSGEPIIHIVKYILVETSDAYLYQGNIVKTYKGKSLIKQVVSFKFGTIITIINETSKVLIDLHKRTEK